VSKKFPLRVLHELAQNRSDEATRNLGSVMSEEQAMLNKLQLLLKYRDDYRDRYRAAIKGGMNQAGWRNYQDFLDKLEVAIEQQRAALGQSQQATAIAKEEWRNRQSRLKAYGTLNEQHQRAEQAHADKREQCEHDEIAGLAAYKGNRPSMG
jgi:flagellar FliJ protein